MQDTGNHKGGKESSGNKLCSRGGANKNQRMILMSEKFGRELTFRGGRLLAGGVFESGEAGEDSAKHEDERDEEPRGSAGKRVSIVRREQSGVERVSQPDDAPDAARNQRTQGSELGGIRLVHLAEHEVIDNVPDAVQARHDPVK